MTSYLHLLRLPLLHGVGVGLYAQVERLHVLGLQPHPALYADRLEHGDTLL